MWPYPWTHVGTPSHLGHMDRMAATMPSQAHAGAAQEAPYIGQWEGQDVFLVRPSSCNVKGGIPSSRRYLPTYLRVAPVSFVLGGECNGLFLTGTQSLLFDRFSWIIFWIFDGMFCDRRRQDRSARQIPRQIVADDRRKIKREVNNRCLLSVQIIFSACINVDLLYLKILCCMPACFSCRHANGTLSCSMTYEDAE